MSGIMRFTLIVGLSLLSSACGKKGPLIYPDMLIPAAPAAVAAQQSGTAVKLRLTLPDKDRAGRPVQGVTGVKISRRTAEADQKDVCRHCMTDYRLFQTLYLDHLPSTSQRFGSRLIFLDSDVSAGNVYSYSVVPFTADGVNGSSSAPADVRVSKPQPAPVLKVESFPTEVKLQFYLPPLTAGGLIGFNIYRSSATTARLFEPLNRDPLKGSDYVDTTLERGVKYRYTASALVVPVSGDIMESAESDVVEGMLKDDE